MTIGKRHWVLAGLILALGTAVYLNWQFAPAEEYVDNTPSVALEETLGDAQFVGATPQQSVSQSDSQNGCAVATSTPQELFAQMRTDRSATRADALATLQNILDDASVDSAQKTEAVNTAADIAKRMEAESAIESLIKAKGYKDCVVVISDTQVNVVVPPCEEGITAAAAAIIKDIVVGQVDISPSSIKIIEAK